jgi:molybdenum cofactor synthesis domain-containing protein
MTDTSPRFGLIIVGDEILSGKRADKHMPKVIELLAARGLQLAYAEYVGDEPDRITAALKRAFDSGDIVFSTGGIGATPDDHTRQCAARALGRALALHPQAEALIRERMQDVAKEQGVAYEPDRPDNIHRLNMGVFPVGSEIIPNPYNKIAGFSIYADPQDLSAAGPSREQSDAFDIAGASAPSGGSAPREAGERGGVHLSAAGQSQGASAPSGGSAPREVGERGGVHLSAAGPSQGANAPSGGSAPREAGERGGVHFLPGFPVMAWPMVEWVLDHRYKHLHRQAAYLEKSLIVMGAMEAALTPLMEQVESAHPQVKVFSLPSVDHPSYGRHIELGIKGRPESVEAAYPMLKSGLVNFGAQIGPELVRS